MSASSRRLRQLAGQLTQDSPAAAGGSAPVKVLVLGGLGAVGSGLRTYLPKVSSLRWEFTSVDLPGAEDKAPLNGVGKDLRTTKYYGDILHEPELLDKLLPGMDMVVYLARRNDLDEMNAMTDLVFERCIAQSKPPFILSASSIHAVDGAYSVDRGVLSLIAERKFDEIEQWPEMLPATTSSVGDLPYTQEKRHAEDWCKKYAAAGHGCIAARWGGINPVNQVYWGPNTERGYFTLFCHQEDSARFVDACYSTYLNGNLPSGAHYFVISGNKYRFFDIETPAKGIGYKPAHDAEAWMTVFGHAGAKARGGEYE